MASRRGISRIACQRRTRTRPMPARGCMAASLGYLDNYLVVKVAESTQQKEQSDQNNKRDHGVALLKMSFAARQDDLATSKE